MNKSEKSNRVSEIYCKSLLSRKVYLSYNDIDKNIVTTLENKLKQQYEGKCCNEGYIKIGSIQVISYSTGELSSDKIIYNVVFDCLLTIPVESMIISCNVKSITKVGIRAEIKTDDNISPYIIFIARDHHYTNKLFSKVKENDVIKVKVLGQRYELNDKFISVIAQLIDIDNYEISKTEMIEDLSIKSKFKSHKNLSGKQKNKLKVEEE
jgi:DNA-directed RNA polymerase subunit E'/Rpb7